MRLKEIKERIKSLNEYAKEYNIMLAQVEDLVKTFDQVEEDFITLYMGVHTWVRQKCGTEVYNDFYNFFEEQVKLCKIIGKKGKVKSKEDIKEFLKQLTKKEE